MRRSCVHVFCSTVDLILLLDQFTANFLLQILAFIFGYSSRSFLLSDAALHINVVLVVMFVCFAHILTFSWHNSLMPLLCLEIHESSAALFFFSLYSLLKFSLLDMHKIIFFFAPKYENLCL